MDWMESKEKRAKAIKVKKADKNKGMFDEPKSNKKHRIAELRKREIDE